MIFLDIIFILFIYFYFYPLGCSQCFLDFWCQILVWENSQLLLLVIWLLFLSFPFFLNAVLQLDSLFVLFLGVFLFDFQLQKFLLSPSSIQILSPAFFICYTIVIFKILFFHGIYISLLTSLINYWMFFVSSL